MCETADEDTFCTTDGAWDLVLVFKMEEKRTCPKDPRLLDFHRHE